MHQLTTYAINMHIFVLTSIFNIASIMFPQPSENKIIDLHKFAAFKIFIVTDSSSALMSGNLIIVLNLFRLS